MSHDMGSTPSAGWPATPFAPPSNRAWREGTLTRAAELQTLLNWFRARSGEEDGQSRNDLDAGIQGHLDEALHAAEKGGPWRPSRTAALVERVTGNLNAAEADLLRRAPEDFFRGQIPHLLAHIRLHLFGNDPRRQLAEKLAGEAQERPLEAHEREAIIQAVWVGSLESRREFIRVRNFRGVLLVTAVVLTFVAAGAGIWGWRQPEHLDLCFHPPVGQVCPVGDEPSAPDIVLVEFVGLLAAAVSAAASLRHLNGWSTPVGLPVALSLLKLPTGALTAVLGLVLMRGGFVPGLSDLDSSAQILAWAVVFGAAQQLFTKLVDRQASTVVDQTRDRSSNVSVGLGDKTSKHAS